jgi:hypothetical protein
VPAATVRVSYGTVDSRHRARVEIDVHDIVEHDRGIAPLAKDHRGSAARSRPPRIPSATWVTSGWNKWYVFAIYDRDGDRCARSCFAVTNTPKPAPGVERLLSAARPVLRGCSSDRGLGGAIQGACDPLDERCSGRLSGGGPAEYLFSTGSESHGYRCVIWARTERMS